ncbi:fumarylacetoacetate hydrolase family protein [Noviherbaspirillum aerium]|uniref:fumarylacetoacetate hydrolase family protein n=1 Tax=Noviherbaspirillum aerium TaxID=2588497 RepID=UPI00124E809E|nr:fumarylacetoacetate hydrolase family protein [Noviherbaspirillum aerium]
MKLVSYIDRRKVDPAPSFGALVGASIIDLSTTDISTVRDALTFGSLSTLAEQLEAQRGKDKSAVPLEHATLLPPVTNPDKILCVGLNYHLHAKEANMPIPARPSVFVRFASSFAGPDQPVLRPLESEQFDYEAELAVVIGRPARRVTEADAMQYVAGYMCMAENSIRDWQKHATQATAGKNFMHSGALGPCLVTADEAPGPDEMQVVGRLNGEVVQDDSASNMIFTVAQIIAYLSTFTELLPGDIIATGTPAGVGMSKKPPCYLRNGDVFEVEITGLGVLRNPVHNES